MSLAPNNRRPLWRDPILLALIALIVVALVPLAFVGSRLARGSGANGTPSPTPAPTHTPLPTLTPTPTATPTPVPTPTPTVVEAPLSGLEVDPQRLLRPPIVVMIPSDSEQYALSQASVVYEARAEYNIPRFMGIFEQLQAEQIGPIRSARDYYVRWACPYGPLFVHWGGSPQAYALLAELNKVCLYELDGQSYEGVYFWRGYDPVIPWNNGFSSSELLYEYLDEKPLLLGYQGYAHKDDAPPETRPLTGTISLSFVYSVRYTYDPEQNDYVRFYKGGPHVDMLTGQQHRVKNVVVVFVPQSKIPDDPKGRLEMETVGTGDALFFLDGRLIEGRWEKLALEAEMRFFDASGEEIAFNRGNIWIEVLAPGDPVDYALGRVPEP